MALDINYSEDISDISISFKRRKKKEQTRYYVVLTRN